MPPLRVQIQWLQRLTHTSHASLGYGFKTSELDDAGDDASSEDSEVR